MKKEFEDLIKHLINNKITITTMESCTSGSLASMITDVESSSEIFRGGFVTYSNEAKIKQGVEKWKIDMYGVYSIDIACEMAMAAQKQYNTDIAIGVTGTIGNLDKHNSDSVSNKIEYAIRIYDKNFLFHFKLNSYENRTVAKKMICEDIFLSLNRLISKEYI